MIHPGLFLPEVESVAVGDDGSFVRFESHRRLG